MKQISELILFRSQDKNPYNFKPDSIFSKVIPSTQNKQIIDELSLNSYDFRFTECFNLWFSYDTVFEQENKLPYDANSNENTYLIEGIVSTGNNIFTSDDRLDFSNFASNRYQALLKTNEGIWFILYADLTPEPTTIDADEVIQINLQAPNVKEEFYRVVDFNLIPAAAQIINTDNNGNILLDSNNNLTINVDGTNL